MGGLLSVTFDDIYMIKSLFFIVVMLMTSIIEEKKFKHDELFEKLDNYHPNIKLTIEVSLAKPLDTSLHLNKGIYDFKVYRKTTNQSTHRPSKIPKRYQRNMILGDLHRSNRISSSFSEEIKFISHKYEKADYPKRFINSVIRQIQDKSNHRNIDYFDDYIIPSNFFDIPKYFI